MPEKQSASTYNLVGEETKQKGYKGGLVLEPEVGMYEDYVVLVDFNSLYPSIIRNFNICFTTITRNLLEYDGGLAARRPKAKEDQTKTDQIEQEEENVNPDEQKHEQVDYLSRIRNTRIELVEGEYKEIQNRETPILVRIVTLLIEKRKQVKGLLKNKGLSPVQRRKFDIMQTAYKLTANSIYGCLGFPNSRFYSRLIADTVTGLGRQLLVQSKEKVEENGYRVIYGDTDSIMINTESRSIQEAVQEATKIKSLINQMFRKRRTTGADVEFEDQHTSDKYNQKYNKDSARIEEEAPAARAKAKPAKRVGSQEGVLQVGIDGVYKKLLLIRKKKYAGLMVVNWNEVAMRRQSVEKTKLEMKGLEVVRRDCSQVTREITRRAIEIIMYHENYLELLESHLIGYKNALDTFAKTFNRPREQVEALAPGEILKRTQRVQYKVNAEQQDLFAEKSLNSQSDSTRNGLKQLQTEEPEPKATLPYSHIGISLNSFVIKKMLNKALNRYTETDNLPHVMVAKYLIEKENKSEDELVGRFIPYIITETPPKVTSIGKKSKHITAIRKTNANVDIEWYKCNQIQPILSRSIGVVNNIDDDFINKMLGIEATVAATYDEHGKRVGPMQKEIRQLPKYFKNMLRRFGLKRDRQFELFLAVCSTEHCPGCSVFETKCPKKQLGLDADSQLRILKDVRDFEEEEIMLRLETTLMRISSAYRKSLKTSVVGNPFEIVPLLDRNMNEVFKGRYGSIDGYYEKMHVCFYVYFLLFKIALIRLYKFVKKESLGENTNKSLQVIWNYEADIREPKFLSLLRAVNSKLKGFRTNYLSELIDFEQITV